MEQNGVYYNVWNGIYNRELWLAHVLTHKNNTQPYLYKRNVNFIDRQMILLVLWGIF